MKLRKSIFVTALVAGMLVVINLCLYFLDNPAYLVLTGGIVLYGFLCGAVDFCGWLCQSDPAPKRIAAEKKPAPVVSAPKDNTEVFDWAQDEEMSEGAQGSTENDEAIMKMLNGDI